MGSAVFTSNATLVRNMLNGVFNIYKPAGLHPLQVRSTIISNLCRDLNDMQVTPPMQHVFIEGATNEEMKVAVKDSWADHPLVAGPRNTNDQFKMGIVNRLSRETSGVMICGINAGTRWIIKLRESKLTKFYRVKGMLGQTRVGNFATGKILEKSVWKNVKRPNIDKVCASMQASHQKKMFEHCGVDMQSQEAFELAAKGPVRPADPKIPMIYSIKCVEFKPPQFTLEIVSIHEDDDYLKSLIAEVGYRVHTSAHCTYIQCSQYAHFNVKDALLAKHWDLQSILHSIEQCRKIIKENPYMLVQDNANLVPAQQKVQQL